MLRSCFTSICVSILCSWASAQSSQNTFIEQFASSRLSMPPADAKIFTDSSGRYPQPLKFIFENVLNWTPTGEPKVLSQPCSNEVWEQRLLDSRVKNNPALQGALVQKYFQDCASELETGMTSQISNFRKMMTISLDTANHSFLRKVVLNLPGNVKLKGLLGLKGDFKRRPFVIVRLGIFSSIEDFKPERAWMMMLFEQAPFNILILENMSSPDFVSNNNQFSFGGYDEGIQNIHVARLLRDSNEPISQLVDSVHMFGISLGGHGVLYSSLLNKYNSPAKSPLIQSYTALCPVVNLKPTMESLTQDGMKSALVDLWSRQRLHPLESKMPGLENYGRFAFLSTTVSEVVRTYHGGLSYNSSIKLPPGSSDADGFWEVNDFWKDYKAVTQPVLIYATKKDPAVPYNLNSEVLLKKEMKDISKNIRVVELPEGVHCTLPAAYDWHTLSSIFQTYILSHSPDFKMQERSLELELSDEEWKGFFDKDTKVTFEVEQPGKKSGFAIVEISVENSKGKTKSMNLSLPLSQFDFRFFNNELSGPEQEMMVRWMNQNLHMTIISREGTSLLKASWKVAQ